MEEKKECCHCHKKKERSEKEYKDMINRLNRIEGQVRGVKRMVEEDAYCPDILIQVSAINAARGQGLQRYPSAYCSGKHPHQGHSKWLRRKRSRH